MTTGRWRDHAACTDTEPDLFFGDNGLHSAEAKRVCARCPVRRECLDFALSVEGRGDQFVHGVYGGLVPAERIRLRAAS